MISIYEQIKLIIYFLLFGMFLAIMYDVLHFYLNKFKIKLLIGYIIQFLYWTGLVYLACIYMLKVSRGYLTIYTFGFFLIGIIIHMYILSKHFISDLERVDKWMVRIILRMKRIIIIVIYPKEFLMFLKWIFPKKLVKKLLYYISPKRIIKNIKDKMKNKKKENTDEEIISFFNIPDSDIIC